MAFRFERSPDTDTIIDILRGCNDQIEYVVLAHRANLPLERTKSLLPTARRALRKEGILFGTITGHGIHRLTDADKVKKPEAFKRRVFRGAGREIKDLTTISDFGKLSKTDQHAVTLNRTILTAMKQSAGVKPDKATSTGIAPSPLPNTAVLVGQRK